MNLIFEKGEVPNDFRETLIKPLYKKGDKSECGNYQGISLVSIGSKSLSNMILFRLRDAVECFKNVILEKVEDVSTKFHS